MKEQNTIDEVIRKLKKEFQGEATGHDWFHIERVWKLSVHIASAEEADLFVTQLTALLHDIADHKFVTNADKVAAERIEGLLLPLGVSQKVVNTVIENVRNCSFKNSLDGPKEVSRECQIVQDADRLEAIGAIGIARTFAFGGKVGNPIYDPEISPSEFKNSKDYLSKRTHTINHFYEKLLRLKDGMNTKTAREIAEQRHQFMESFLEQFYAEWELTDLTE